MYGGSKAQNKEQMRRYALWFLLGGVCLTVLLVGMTYRHLLASPDVQIQKKQAPDSGDGRVNRMTQRRRNKDAIDGRNADSEMKRRGQTSSTTRVTWKAQELRSVPAELLESAAKATVVKTIVSVTVGDAVLKVQHREVNLTATKKPDVLFLHGARFESKTWQDIGTLQLVAAMGHRAVAVDLPGHGGSDDLKERSRSAKEFLSAFIGALKLDRPIVVSPSMSGIYSLPFLLKPTADGCTGRVSGFVPIAPAATMRFKTSDYEQCKAPTLIIYGEKDKSAQVSTLSQLPNSESFAIKEAGHVCYKDDPKEWHRLLYNFLRAVAGQ